MTTQTYKCSKCGLDYEPNEFTREWQLEWSWDQDEEEFYVETTCVACTELTRLRLVDIKKEVARQHRFDPYWKVAGYVIIALILFWWLVLPWIELAVQENPY